MATSGRHSNGFASPSIVLKIGLVLASAISLFLLLNLLVPHVSSLLSVALPQIWAVISAWTAPPYLFITVHFIILVIWKLSDHKPSREHMWAPHQDHQAVKPKQQQVSPLSRETSPEIPRSIPTRSNGWAPSGQPVAPKHNISAEVSPKISQGEPGHFQRAPREEPPLPKQRKSREVSPKTSRNASHRASSSDESCLTEEKSDEKSTASSQLEMRRSEKPVPAPEKEFVRRVEPKPQESAVVEEGEVEDDSLDATWKAIMAKSPRPVVPTNTRASEPEVSVGADEMNQRFEEFIRRSRNQMGFQVEEPNRHRRGLAMANAAF